MLAATDEELMRGVVQGDARAFRLLVERHRNGVMRLAFEVVRDRFEAEDIVQEAFERVWTKAASWRNETGARFFSWVARITVNLAIDRKRKPTQIGLDEISEMPSGEINSEQALAGKQIGRRIAGALETLPERQRVAFALCQIDRMGNADAAMSLGISVGALELLLVRARKKMRQELADLVVA